MRVSGYEHMLIIKPLYEDNIIYLLAHLSEEKRAKKDDFVAPGEEVAQLGSGQFSPHLHLSVLRTDKVEKDDIIKKEGDAYEWKETPIYVDPFNHTIRLQGGS